MGVELTEDQLKVANSLTNNDRVSTKSGHAVGKSCLAAIAALWFKYSYSPSIVLTTAPTERQVKEVLWREIRHRKASALVELPGTPLTMKMDLGPIDYMLGFSTKGDQQLQGFHSSNIMVIIDEANGYPEELFDPIEGLLSGGERKVLFQIGNPITPNGRFFESFSDGVTCTHTISCLNHPNVISGENIISGAVTREWVVRQEKLWGKDSAFWQSRVLGQFPRHALDSVIDLDWIELAEQLVLKEKELKGDVYMGLDSAEYGNDDYVWYIGTNRRKIEIIVRRHIEPAESIGITKRLKEKYNILDRNISIDGIGAGAVIYSVLREDGILCRRFVSSERAKDDKTYEDKATEAWFNTRNLLNPDADDYKGYSFMGRADRVKADLCTRRFKTSRKGRFMLEPKEEYRKRMKRSPDYGDAFSLCYSPLVRRKIYGFVALPDVIG